jgi:type III secretory pathway component EscU
VCAGEHKAKQSQSQDKPSQAKPSKARSSRLQQQQQSAVSMMSSVSMTSGVSMMSAVSMMSSVSMTSAVSMAVTKSALQSFFDGLLRFSAESLSNLMGEIFSLCLAEAWVDSFLNTSSDDFFDDF